MNTALETVFFQNGDVRLHAVAAGHKDAPVVLLLHGFPEFWYGWHRQIEPLAAAGFRVIVPDQRGYNLSSKPRGVRRYALRELTSDVLAIADQLGQRKIFLAGRGGGVERGFVSSRANREAGDSECAASLSDAALSAEQPAATAT